jgi:hypothetical protein
MIAVRLSLLLCLAVGGGLVYWTQTLARTYGYHPALGPALWEVRPWRGIVYPLYAPWQALVWQWQWGEATITWVLVGSASVGLAGTMWWWLRRDAQGAPPPMEGHGTGKWARRRDVKKAGLF